MWVLAFSERVSRVGLALLNRPRLFAGIAACVSVLGQTVTPSFEVVSIKPHAPGSGLALPGCTGDRFSSAGVLFGNVLQWAYELQRSEFPTFLERVPPSLDESVYDIQAKADGPIASESQCRVMVQALLADRFKLAAHRELRDAEVSDLAVARGGPKIRAVLATDEGTDVSIVVNGRPIARRAPVPAADTKGLTMQELAQILTGRAAPPDRLQVVDKTGLEGRYKIDLRFSISLPAGGQDSGDPPLDAALTQQLGLRLEKHKGSVNILVLDHIEPPSPN